MDKPPDNAKCQMDMKLKQLIQDKECKSIISTNAKEVLSIIQIIENATVQYRRDLVSFQTRAR